MQPLNQFFKVKWLVNRTLQKNEKLTKIIGITLQTQYSQKADNNNLLHEICYRQQSNSSYLSLFFIHSKYVCFKKYETY